MVTEAGLPTPTMTISRPGSGLLTVPSCLPCLETPFLGPSDISPHLTLCRATQMVYGVEPDLTREGGSIPVTLTLQEATGKNVILLPMGASDDGAHSQNEKIDIRNYIQGTKLLGAYAYELGNL